jgi:hypothetical protein
MFFIILALVGYSSLTRLMILALNVNNITFTHFSKDISVDESFLGLKRNNPLIYCNYKNQITNLCAKKIT